MAILGTFIKQPLEVLDYDVNASGWIDPADYILTATAVAAAGLTVDSVAIDLVNQTVKVWISGGTDGTKYKVEVTVTTQDGRVKQSEFYIVVKDY